MKIRTLLFFLSVSLFSRGAQAGVFLKIDSATMNHDSFIVVHPLGYDGTGGEIALKVCPEDPDFKDATQTIIELWNTLMAETENCKNCFLLEDPPVSTDVPFDLTSVLLHEIGHCAMGLGHTNWPGTSYTATQNAVAIDEGTDMVRGSLDDSVTPFPGSRVVHWFREADNNPVVIDGTTIDGTTYIRRFQDLPSGSNWPANANRDVAEAVGFSDTQSLMYSTLEKGTQISAIDADAVNTVKLGMTGVDLTAGTADDYTIALKYHADCGTADVVIRYFTPMDPDEEDTIGACASDIEQIDKNNTVHYRVKGPVAGINPFIQINDTFKFDIIFGDDFESGGLSRWSE